MIADCETCERKQVPCKSCQDSQRAICYRCQGDVDDPYCELEPQRPAGRLTTTRFDEVSCKQLTNCGWPECDCPRKVSVHSPEAVAYAFNKARELLLTAGWEETAAILHECKPQYEREAILKILREATKQRDAFHVGGTALTNDAGSAVFIDATKIDNAIGAIEARAAGTLSPQAAETPHD